MAWLGGRTYCNTVCPVGTILGYISKFALLRPEINTDTCNNCGRCARNCKASCIDPKAHKIDYTRCVACFDCMENCSTGALTYRLRTKTESKPNDVKHVDASRRNFISMATILAGAAAASAEDKIVDGGLAPIAEKGSDTQKSYRPSWSQKRSASATTLHSLSALYKRLPERRSPPVGRTGFIHAACRRI